MGRTQPFVFWDIQEVDGTKIPIPHLGEKAPAGWELVREVVLGDGLVTTDDRFVTPEGFRNLAKLATANREIFGFAIIKADPFMVTIGIFKKVPVEPKASVTFLDPDDDPMRPIYAGA